MDANTCNEFGCACPLIGIKTWTGFIGNQNDDQYFELSEVGIAQEREDFMTQMEQESFLSESSELARTRKTGKCNLRKSLAWDSAFFTSAGVLEPEELSIINCGLKKVVKHPLPGIEEDIRRSAESNSTFDSDNLTLESLEVDLFGDVRASIQRSSKGSNLAYPNSLAGPGKSGAQTSAAPNLRSSRKMQVVSRNMMKPTAASKRQIVNTPGPERSRKEPEKTKKEAERTKREVEGIKKEATVCPRAVQAAARSAELNTSSLRPPRIAGRVNSVLASPPKRTSLGANRVKIENSTAKAATGRRETIGGSKRPVYAHPSVTPRSMPSPKSSASSSASCTKIESAASCSSNSISGSASYDSTDKTPLKPLRKKINCRNANLPSPSSLKSPLRISSRNKTETGNSHIAAYLMSVPKLSSSISPASSIDGRSSESSSSTSVNQLSNSSMKSLDMSSPRRGCYIKRDAFQSDVQKHLNDQPSIQHKRTGLPNPGFKKTTVGAGLRPSPTDVSRSSKPSGLRMPSPKIGFFDAEKSTEHSPVSGLQFHPGVWNAIPKHGARAGSLNGGTIKAKPGKLLPARSIAGSSINCDADLDGMPHCASSMRITCPAQFQQVSNVSPTTSVTRTTRVDFPGMKSKSQNDVRIVSGTDLMAEKEEEMNNTYKESGSFLKESASGGQTTDVNKTGASGEKVSATKISSEYFPGITTILLNDVYGTDIENHLKTGEARELPDTERDGSSYCLNIQELDEQDAFVIEFSTTSEKVSAYEVSGENCPGMTSKLQNDIYHRTGGESHLITVEVLEQYKGEECLFAKEEESHCEVDVVSEVASISPKLLPVSSSTRTPSQDVTPNSCLSSSQCNYENINKYSESVEQDMHGLDHLESKLNYVRASNEKENSLCSGNQVDGLSRRMGTMDLSMEELNVKKGFPLSLSDDNTDNPDCTKSVLSSSSDVLVHVHEDLPMITPKAIPQPLLPTIMDAVPRTRAPLVNLSMCNGTGSFELESELTIEKSPRLSFTEGLQTDNI
ncbi:hypothetical protein IFM89_013692 [Coptis chinensis]|uniref:Uncharacterized protein n=1 Tax=Coptis chinensis TaxID=261450 RepID=A0A835GW35_9MAGN|nr:hypothetical protein IFM89_013692 [Coptis chinensis]